MSLTPEFQAWLNERIQGVDLLAERSNLVTSFVKAFPEASLKEIQEIDDKLRSLLYQSHKRFEVEGIIVCKCKKVTQDTLITALEAAKNLEELKVQTHAGTGCGTCVPILVSLLEKNKPKTLRWHSEPHSYWSAKVQESLDLWNERITKYPSLKVKSFDQGQVKIFVDGTLNSDQEWDLSLEISDYLAEGFPEPLVVFLDFAHSAAKS
jgi:bacterioferritin-associated ferredoxin